MQVNAWICAPAAAGDLESASRNSVRTRKMVNNAWTGHSLGRLWWRLVAMLTCKSFVILGERGRKTNRSITQLFFQQFL